MSRRTMARFNALDRIMGWNRNRYDMLHEEERALLRNYRNEELESAIPADDVTRVCLKLRHLIQECVPCEMDEGKITTPHSQVLTPQVIKTAKEAGGQDFRGCVVYGLLVNSQWFSHEAEIELWDAGLHNLRALACGVIAKEIIETEDDSEYLMHNVLLRRYSFLSRGNPTPPVNVIEKAVDQHCISVIASSGYQRCIGFLWKGWLVQDENNPSVFVEYKDKDNPNFIAHMDPDRMRAPRNQNAARMLFSIIYLILYTGAINSVNPSGDFDATEVAMYVFTLGFICDEVLKVYKAGYHILGFWNAFNGLLYAFLFVSLVLRIVGLASPHEEGQRNHLSTQSYNLLAFVAPLFWTRLLLYLDGFKFFGAMLVVLKVMMKESIIFFALLFIMVIGFLQAFIGLDLTEDDVAGDVLFIIENMAKAVLQSPEFEGFETFGPPWGLILYYCFTFVIMIILLNILIALYNSAYEDIYEDADNEFLALFAMKTMQFVRAPDENVYIAPLNLIEIVLSGLTEWWMPKKTYETINDWIMGMMYSPLLFVAAYFETRDARGIRSNRARGEEDDDVLQDWERTSSQISFESENWKKTCDAVKPNLDIEPAVVEVQKLREEVEELKAMLTEVIKAVGAKQHADGEQDGKAKKKDDAKDGGGSNGSD